jgi:arylsulfatase A-like enzyme
MKRTALLLALAATAAAERPNILFIMTDDHAAHAMSCYGSKVNSTPQMDRLAKGGTRFTNAFVTNSICTPSRATLLTGKYSHANGTPVFNTFDGSQQTVAKLLQGAGYHTGMIGKWHLGSEPTGFDRWVILPGQGVYNDPAFLTPAGRLTIKGYATDITTDLGVEWLETRPKDKPFLLFLHHKAPHREWTPSEKYREEFAKKTFPEPGTLFDKFDTRPAALPENQQTLARDFTHRDLKIEAPADLPPGPKRQQWNGTRPKELEVKSPDGSVRKLTGDDLTRHIYQRYMQDYLACVQSVDDGIGRVLDYLDKNGLSKNTIVIYTADNGFFLGDMGLYDKRFMYEPSLRVPLLASGPGVKAGAVTDSFALNVDFAPTFLDLAGEKIPADMQGRSLAPILRGETPGDWRTTMYYRYYHDPGHHNTRAHYGVRTATHKLIYYWKKDAWEMFDLVADPTEQRNLAGDPAHSAKLAELKAELARVKAAVKDNDEYSKEQPKDGVDAQRQFKPLGIMTIADAVKAAAVK